MAKAMKNTKREKKKLLDERSLLINAALDQGFVTRHEIKTATGLELHHISDTLTKNRELNAKYKVRRKVVADIAADNIHRIVMNPNHSKNYEASKLIMSKYKTDLDDTLEHIEDEGLGVEIGGNTTNPVRLVFSKSKPKNDD